MTSYQPDYHTDIPRLLKGGVGAQFWAAEGSMGKHGKGKASSGICLEDIGLIHRMAEKYPAVFEMAYTADS